MSECAASYGSSVCRVFGNGLKASESVEKFRGTDLWGGEIGAALRPDDGHSDVEAGASGSVTPDDHWLGAGIPPLRAPHAVHGCI